MRKLTLLISAFIVAASFKYGFGAKALAQASLSQIVFNTRTDMRLQAATANTQALLNGLVTMGDNNGGNYMWDATNTSADDGFLVLAVNNVATGRWVRLGNSNTIKFQRTLNGILLTTAYTVPFPMTLPYTPITVLVQPRSANAAVPSWVSDITTTGFTVNFSSVPVVGTNNIIIDIIVVKQ